MLKIVSFIGDCDDWNWQPANETTLFLKVKIFSEYRRKNTIFRCHPDYRKEGPWKDWIMLKWEEDDVEKFQPDLKFDYFVTDGDEPNTNCCYAPGKLVSGFFEIEHKDGSFEYFATVWSCGYKYIKSSVFTTKWKLAFKDEKNKIDPIYEVVSCDTFVRHCLMIPKRLLDEKGCTEFEEIWSRDLWCNEF